METKPALINEVVLNQDNYLDWSVRVKTYLMAQNLWDLFESSGEASTLSKKGASKSNKPLSKKNARALQVIQMFCGPDTFSNIREISSAKTAWDTLAEKYR